MRSLIEILFLAGLCLICVGLFMLAIWAGLIATGAAVCLVSAVLYLASPKPVVKDEPPR